MEQLAADSPNNPHPIPTPELCDQAASHTRGLSLQLFVKWLFNIDCINPITSLLLRLLCAEDARLLSVWQHRVFSCHRSKSCCAASSVYPAVIGDSSDSSAYRAICKQTGVFHLQKRTTKTKVRVIRTKKKGKRHRAVLACGQHQHAGQLLLSPDIAWHAGGSWGHVPATTCLCSLTRGQRPVGYIYFFIVFFFFFPTADKWMPIVGAENPNAFWAGFAALSTIKTNEAECRQICINRWAVWGKMGCSEWNDSLLI